LTLPSGEQCPSLPHPLNRLSSIIGWVRLLWMLPWVLLVLSWMLLLLLP
jgi:hypothetical protein